MSNYDKEYFFSFNDYEKMLKNQPISLYSYNDFKFDFYEMRFSNGVVVYLLNTLKEAIEFKKYCNLSSENIPYIGEMKDIDNRIIFESLNRNTQDFISLCNQLAEDRTFCFLYVPFKLSW